MPILKICHPYLRVIETSLSCSKQFLTCKRLTIATLKHCNQGTPFLNYDPIHATRTISFQTNIIKL